MLQLKRQTDPQCFCLWPQALGAHLHDWIRAEGDAHFVLADCCEPQGCVALQLQRRNQDRLVTRVHTESRNVQTKRKTWRKKKTLGENRRKFVSRFFLLVILVRFTCTGTRERSRGRSRDPDRWRSAGRGRAHTAVWWSDTRHWWQRETSEVGEMTQGDMPMHQNWILESSSTQEQPLQFFSLAVCGC